ncbi:hypothetical protein GNF10_27005 [Nostoc sp. UCD121]|uniref:hypothetical protein n=1 Tax=Nostoc sp. UCD121 TaxID=2681305 RepID=UPI001623661D|nr:hypothetical protein [Nostoc sp. UCD121]MBC1279508.1 hypothetical protein [Nostoc sp. UCD121]MBC1298119.1 hypothetical protein [Nostoc sp. UCD122]
MLFSNLRIFKNINQIIQYNSGKAIALKTTIYNKRSPDSLYLCGLGHIYVS